MKTKEITFKEFTKDFKDYYKCNEAEIRNVSEAEIIMWDLYEVEDYEFDYERRIIELYY